MPPTGPTIPIRHQNDGANSDVVRKPCCNAASPAGGKIRYCAPPQPDPPQAPAYRQSAIPTIGQTSCLERKLELFLDRVVLLYGRVAPPRLPTVGLPTVGVSDYGTDLLSAQRFTVNPCKAPAKWSVPLSSICRPRGHQNTRRGLSIYRPRSCWPYKLRQLDRPFAEERTDQGQTSRKNEANNKRRLMLSDRPLVSSSPPARPGKPAGLEVFQQAPRHHRSGIHIPTVGQTSCPPLGWYAVFRWDTGEGGGGGERGGCKEPRRRGAHAGVFVRWPVPLATGQ
jgi:hypothetical protein